MRVLSTYIRSGVKKRPVDGDLGSDGMVKPFYIWHENFITAEKFVRKGNFKGSYLDFYWFTFLAINWPISPLVPASILYWSLLRTSGTKDDLI
jgi:hypothetical protein